MKVVDFRNVADTLSPGESIFVSGASGEPVGVMDSLAGSAGRDPGLQIINSFVPGINPVDLQGLHPSTTLTQLFRHPGLDEAVEAGRVRHLPLSYGAFTRWASQSLRIDTLIVQVAPPDPCGRASLGPHVEFVPTLLARARRVIAIINPNVPTIPRSAAIDLSRVDIVAQSDVALRTYASGDADPASAAIAANIAPFIRDGATLQVGIGKIPPALLTLLADRRKLKLWSGLISPGVRTLIEAGAIAQGAGSIVGCSALGDAEFYAWCAGREDLEIRGCDATHDVRTLAERNSFIAVNSAIEVDLLGQVNLETIGSRGVSGVGGAPDFAFAASLAQNGVSIVALPSTTPRNYSRIVPRLAAGTPVSLPRNVIDVVVTEHGSADLRGLSALERATAIASIASPEHREALITSRP